MNSVVSSLEKIDYIKQSLENRSEIKGCSLKNVIKTACSLFGLLSLPTTYADTSSIKYWYKGPIPPECKPPVAIECIRSFTDFKCPIESKVPNELNDYYSPEFQSLISPEIICPIDKTVTEYLRDAKELIRKETTIRYIYNDDTEVLNSPSLFKIYQVVSKFQKELEATCLSTPDNRVRCLSPYDLIELAIKDIVDLHALSRCSKTLSNCNLNEKLFYSLNGVGFAHPTVKIPEVTVIASINSENDYNGAFEFYNSFSLSTLKKVSKVFPVYYFTFDSFDALQGKLEEISRYHSIKVLMIRAHGSQDSMTISDKEKMTEKNLLIADKINLAKDANILLDSCSTGKELSDRSNMAEFFACNFLGSRVTAPKRFMNTNTEFDFDILNGRLYFYIKDKGVNKKISYSVVCDKKEFVDANGNIETYMYYYDLSIHKRRVDRLSFSV